MLDYFFKALTRHKVLAKFMSSSLLGVPVSLITGFVAFRSVDPYYMGVWSTVLVFETYVNILRLGIVNGMNRELPYSLGAGENEKAFSYLRTTYSYTLTNIAVILLITPVVFLYFEHTPEYYFALFVLVFRVIIMFYSTFLSGTFRSNDDFNKLSNVQFTMLLVKLLLVPMVFLGFYGFVLMQAFIVMINAGMLHYYRPFKLSPRFEWGTFKELAKIGLPMFITSYAISFIDTIPRLYIVKQGNEELMGLYSPVFMLLSTATMLPNVISSYVYPKFSYKMGAGNDRRLLWGVLLKMYLVSFLALLVISWIGYLSLDYFVMLFPKYANSLPYLQLAIFIIPFLMFKMGNTLSAVYKSYSTLVYYAIIYFIVQTGSLFVSALFENDVLRIVIYSQLITSISLLIYSFFMNWHLSLYLKKTLNDE